MVNVKRRRSLALKQGSSDSEFHRLGSQIQATKGVVEAVVSCRIPGGTYRRSSTDKRRPGRHIPQPIAPKAKSPMIVKV
jgi:hypothetical protein